MSRIIQVIVLGLTIISGVRGLIACCIPPTPPPITCPAVYPPTTTTTTAAPFVCPYATSTTPQPTTPTQAPTQAPTEAPTQAPTQATTASPSIARNPDPAPTGPTPNYIVMPSNPGIPNMPMPMPMPNMPMPYMPNMPYMYPYPMFGNYMPIVEDPATGQRYYVMPNPNRRTNKYTQTFNIYSPDPMNPGYYVVPSTVAPNEGSSPAPNNEGSTVAPSTEGNNNNTSTAMPSGNS